MGGDGSPSGMNVALQVAANVPEVLGIAGTWVAGRKKRYTWTLALISDVFWLALSVYLAVWVWVPWTAVAMFIHIRNWKLWTPEQGECKGAVSPRPGP